MAFEAPSPKQPDDSRDNARNAFDDAEQAYWNQQDQLSRKEIRAAFDKVDSDFEKGKTSPSAHVDDEIAAMRAKFAADNAAREKMHAERLKTTVSDSVTFGTEALKKKDEQIAADLDGVAQEEARLKKKFE